MSLSKPTSVTKMESLPIDAIEELCRYLSEQDIAICSMVSRSWREIFNDDIVWKPRCCPRLQLEEHLKTTPCAVEPSFTHTVTPGSTLSNISQWKIAKMREKHLWNNIRRGECKETAINHDESKGFPRSCGFLTDDSVFLIFADSIEVWDIRVDPAVKVSERAHTFKSNEITSFTVVGEDKEMAIAVDGFRVRLFNIDFQAGSIVESIVFYFDAIEDVKSIRRNDSYDDVPKYVCSGSFFLGVNRRSNLLHVWDLKHGHKITEHSVDMPECHIIDIFGSQTTTNVLVVLAPEKQKYIEGTNAGFFFAEFSQFVCMVYCMTGTHFLAFKDVSHLSNVYSCAILKHFVAIFDNHSFRIFNYKTSEQLYQRIRVTPTHRITPTHKLFAVGDFFLLINASTNTIFNPETKSSFVEQNIGSRGFHFVCFKTNVLEELHHLGKSCFSMSDQNKTFLLKHNGVEQIGVINYQGMNSSCTRYLTSNQHVTEMEGMVALISALQETPRKMRNSKKKVPKEKERKLIIVKQCW